MGVGDGEGVGDELVAAGTIVGVELAAAGTIVGGGEGGGVAALLHPAAKTAASASNTILAGITACGDLYCRPGG